MNIIISFSIRQLKFGHPTSIRTPLIVVKIIIRKIKKKKKTNENFLNIDYIRTNEYCDRFNKDNKFKKHLLEKCRYGYKYHLVEKLGHTI